ncbi:uncharacterized protein LOC121386682 [Gigantopelta aegis]|uniref:uncharacterized protein LOC121386682 n=1 Tax=Gigantopelta aegis TaxID=1735272 RepID=UPI001B88E76A|nr:uncharacterized protein LOC121386682 [Gigantopelta aegis]
MVIFCNTANDQCIATGGVTDYSVSIDSPTQHTLTIASFNSSVDAGLWICWDGGTGDGQVSCEKKVGIPSPESQVSQSTIIIIAVVAVLLVVAIAVSWFCYKRMKQQPKSEEEQTGNKTQEAEDEKGQHNK